jgi:hypothetical protein
MDIGTISSLEFAVILGALALAGTVKGAIGVGVPIVTVPVLAAIIGLPHAVALMAAPLIFTNLQQIWQFREEYRNAALMGPMLIFAVFGIAAGTSLLVSIDDRVLSAVLGGMILVYAAIFLFKPETRLSQEAGRRLAGPLGFASGALQGMTGISAPVSLVFLHMLRWPRRRFIFAVSCMFLVFGLTQAVTLSVAGVMTPHVFGLSCATLVPIMGFMVLGARIGKAVPTAIFEWIVLGLLVALALRMLWVAAAG